MSRKASAAAYGDSPGYGTIKASPVSRRESVTLPNSEIANDRSPFKLNETQYAHFEACMTKPEEPTEMMLQASETIRLLNKSR
jgi:hypothetical protein